MMRQRKGRLLRNAMTIALAVLSVSASAQWKYGVGNYVILENSSDYVGIGTAAPAYNLHIYSTSNWPVLEIESTTSAGGDLRLKAGNDYWEMYNAGGDLQFAGNDTVRMTIKKGGNIGIDTASPSERLHVKGNIKGDTVKCAAVKINGWMLNAPDYVFEKGYRLPSLREVEKHIALKKHLPDVPSASEIKKNGIDLAEMNMTLLKKVEELTLYVIDQNRKLEEQQKQIDLLKDRIER